MGEYRWSCGALQISYRNILIVIFSEILYYNIYRGISAPVHDREVVDGPNATEKRLVFHLMATMKLPGSQRFDKKMEVHT